MPGYGVEAAATGLLPWEWAESRLTGSHDYWLSTVRPDGAPHCVPVWGVWDGDALWFSSSLRSRKIRNLAVEPRCTVATDNPQEPVVLDGTAEVVSDLDAIRTFLAASNAKYQVDYPESFLDPTVNATVRVTPSSVFGLMESEFTGSPTRWTFNRSAG